MKVNGYAIEPFADLQGASLARANLSQANLAGANLTGADLSRAYLAGANLLGRTSLTAAWQEPTSAGQSSRVRFSLMYVSVARTAAPTGPVRWQDLTVR